MLINSLAMYPDVSKDQSDQVTDLFHYYSQIVSGLSGVPKNCNKMYGDGCF